MSWSALAGENKAPEVFRNKQYDAKADLWSLGCIMYEMVYGRPPFMAQTQVLLFELINKTQEISFPAQPVISVAYKVRSPPSGPQVARVRINNDVQRRRRGRCTDQNAIASLLRKPRITRIGVDELRLLDFMRDPISTDLERSSYEGTHSALTP